MKLFGSLSELVSIIYRKNGQGITLEPSQTVTYTADRVAQLPPQDADSILVSTNATQTLTGKTISGASNTISGISLTAGVTGTLPPANGGTGVSNSSTLQFGADNIILGTVGATNLTLPTTGIVSTRAGAESLSNKTLNNTNTIEAKDSLFSLQDNGDATKLAVFEVSGITTGTTRTFTFPDASMTLVGTAATQTLSNKTIGNSNTVTLSDSLLTVQDNSDATKQVKLEVSGVATGTTRTLTVPDADLIIVGTTTTQTLTGKTISGSANTITNVSLTTGVTGTLPIANGGTGQTAKTAAFDALSPLSTKGDVHTHDGTNNIRLGVGSDGTVLTSTSAAASGLSWTSVLVNPMTTAGDLIVGGVAGAATRLAVGASGTVLHGGTTPTYSQIVNADVGAAAAIDFSKLATLTSANILVGSAGNVATSTAVTGDVTISNAGVTAIGTGKVTSTMILDGTIVNADINASAAIDGSKIVAATASVAGVVTTAAQSFAGLKTFNAGVKIGASGATIDTATLNGTYTPTFDDSAATAVFTGKSVSGVYTRYGNMVTVQIVATWTNQSGGSGYYRFTLPFNVNASAGISLGTADAGNVSLSTNYTSINVSADSSTPTICYISQNGSAQASNRGSVVGLNNTAANRSFTLSLTYICV